MILSAFVLSFPYPIGEQRHLPLIFQKIGPAIHHLTVQSEGEKQPPTPSEIWAGSTIPDEASISAGHRYIMKQEKYTFL